MPLILFSDLQLVTIMTKFASANAILNLVQLRTDTLFSLALTPVQWSAAANEIRLGRCIIKKLQLVLLQSSRSEATEAVKAVASAILEDRHLESLELQIENGFTDEAGVALAEALATNKTLRRLLLDDTMFASNIVHTKARLGAQAYEAFGSMLRVNTSLNLILPDDALDYDVGDKKDAELFNQMLIEQRLNEVGRGRPLTSSQTPREEWINALQELIATNDNDRFKVGCLYSLLRLYPDLCMLELNHSTNPGT
jgi:hypothetical protein